MKNWCSRRIWMAAITRLVGPWWRCGRVAKWWQWRHDATSCDEAKTKSHFIYLYVTFLRWDTLGCSMTKNHVKTWMDLFQMIHPVLLNLLSTSCWSSVVSCQGTAQVAVLKNHLVKCLSNACYGPKCPIHSDTLSSLPVFNSILDYKDISFEWIWSVSLYTLGHCLWTKALGSLQPMAHHHPAGQNLHFMVLIGLLFLCET
jgi:hypothetical protein